MFRIPETCKACNWYKDPDPLEFGLNTGECECPEMDPSTRKISDALASQCRPSTCPFNVRKEIFHGRDEFGYY